MIVYFVLWTLDKDIFELDYAQFIYLTKIEIVGDINKLTVFESSLAEKGNFSILLKWYHINHYISAHFS